MTAGRAALRKNASVTVEAAARLVDVDVATIRHWSDIGALEIERRGDMDVVRLDQVKVLTTSSRLAGAERRGKWGGSMRSLLRDATKIESVSVAGLQQLVREKAGDAS
jgi:hypothetical protein